jgi:hypothetical protein
VKRLSLIILACLCVRVGWSQAAPISGQVISATGGPASGVQIYVCSATSSGSPCSPVATVYQDYGLTIPSANPFLSDSNGNFTVYVPALASPNLYTVNMVPSTGIIYTQVYPGPGCPLSGCTATGPITATLFNATTTPYYEINGVQISSSALSDASNLAKLNVSNVFTGTTQTAPVFNATSGLQIGGTALASTNLSDSANLARLNASNTFTGATNTFATVKGTTINATSGFQVNGVALSASNLSNGASGTGAICLASGSACASSGTVTSVGITSSTSTQLTVSGSPVTSSGSITIGLNLTGTQAKVVTASTAGTATHCANWNSSSGIGDAGGVCLTGASTQTNCLTTSCVGGSTYVNGTSYTNSSSAPVLEEVTMGYATISPGCDYALIAVVGGVTVASPSVLNACGGYQTATFVVPSGVSFSATITYLAGGTSSFAITGWVELTL